MSEATAQGRGGKRGVAVFMLVIGLVAIGAAFLLGKRVIAIGGWPTADATVIERGVGQPEGPTGGSRNARFVPKLKVAFEVDGKRYESTGRGPVQETMTAEDARAWVDAVPEHPTVHYNPDDPSEAYLEPGSLTLAIIAAIFGVLFVIGAIASWR